MTILNKETYFFERDEKGELIPQKIQLKINGNPDVMLTPLTRGEIKTIFNGNEETDKDTDGEIILRHCKDPVFTADELAVAKPFLITAIVTEILKISELKEKGDDTKN